MCLQCTSEAIYVFKKDTVKFLGDYSIMIATKQNEIWYKEWGKNEIGFVKMNDPDFVLKGLKIFPDKVGMNYEEMSDDDDVCSLRYNILDHFDTYIPLGYWITKCAIEEGFDYNNQDLIVWLIHRFHEFYQYMEDDAKKLLEFKYEPDIPGHLL